MRPWALPSGRYLPLAPDEASDRQISQKLSLVYSLTPLSGASARSAPAGVASALPSTTGIGPHDASQADSGVLDYGLTASNAAPVAAPRAAAPMARSDQDLTPSLPLAGSGGPGALPFGPPRLLPPYLLVTPSSPATRVALPTAPLSFDAGVIWAADGVPGS